MIANSNMKVENSRWKGWKGSYNRWKRRIL